MKKNFFEVVREFFSKPAPVPEPEEPEPNRAEYDGCGEENQVWLGTDADWYRDN